MYYQETVTIPASTSKNEALKRTLRLNSGIIRRILVGFPDGACGLVHVQVFDKSWQVLPWTLGESLCWNNYVFDLSMHYELKSEPYALTIYAWNDDDTYEHTVFVGVVLDEMAIERSFEVPRREELPLLL